MVPITPHSRPWAYAFRDFGNAFSSYKIGDPSSAYTLQCFTSVLLDNCVTGMAEGAPSFNLSIPEHMRRKEFRKEMFRDWCIETHRVIAIFTHRVVNVLKTMGKYKSDECLHIRKTVEEIERQWERANALCKKVGFIADFTITYSYERKDVVVEEHKRSLGGFIVIDEVEEEEG